MNHQEGNKKVYPNITDLNVMIREKKLEEIRVFLSKRFSHEEETRDTALNLVVESFYSQYQQQIMEANQS